MEEARLLEAKGSAIRRTLARSATLKGTYRLVRTAGLRAICRTSPTLLATLRYRAAWGRWPDLRNPTTFDEKLLWLNLYWRHPLKAECGDKYTLRGYAERQGLGHLLPGLYGVYESADAIAFDRLPGRFVLKCTHGCKANVFCADKAELDVAGARRALRRWLATDYSLLMGELHYGAMKPRIIAEEFIDDGTGYLPADYKLFCFNGTPTLVLCCTGRAPNDKGSRILMDVEWNPSPFLRQVAAVRVPRRPAALAVMLCAARTLSRPFPFVRIDFYDVGGCAVLGEMTFTPNACINRDYAQEELGRCLKLPPPLTRA